MTIDIVIATYNRADLLSRLLASIERADRPADLSVRTIVVDNNSTDTTPDVIRSAQARWSGELHYRFERIQSKAAASNNGLAAVNGDLVGLLDDDEEVDRNWFNVVRRMFQDSSVDFISGPYLPRWGAEPPSWLPERYRAVIGWAEGGDRVVRYGPSFQGVMLGGNAVIRTALGSALGWYNTALGREGSKVGSGCEDVDLFQRLLASGARGYYVPDLVIYHYIPQNRLTKHYHRSWCYNRSVAQAQADALRPQPVPHVLGIPRYMVGSAARAAVYLATSPLRERDAAEAFSCELVLCELAGYARGVLARRSILKRDRRPRIHPPREQQTA